MYQNNCIHVFHFLGLSEVELGVVTKLKWYKCKLLIKYQDHYFITLSGCSNKTVCIHLSGQSENSTWLPAVIFFWNYLSYCTYSIRIWNTKPQIQRDDRQIFHIENEQDLLGTQRSNKEVHVGKIYAYSMVDLTSGLPYQYSRVWTWANKNHVWTAKITL